MCIFRALKPVAESGLYSLRMPNKYNFAFDYQYALVIVMMSYVPGKFISSNLIASRVVVGPCGKSR